jgi:hypothetical protein
MPDASNVFFQRRNQSIGTLMLFLGRWVGNQDATRLICSNGLG